VGKGTLAALNVSVEDRIRQIQLNLERWRWMPDDLGARYVLVNIPAFEMHIADAGRVVKTLRTIVGRKARPTPQFASAITYLELNPYWHVPPKIAREDLLPKIQADPAYLMRQNFHVFGSWAKDAPAIDPFTIDWSSLSKDHFPFHLRQEPADHNALGRVKFMFPNDRSVYIHDTPGKRLFARPSRPFSSGCVRVEDPLDLAHFLLAGQNWDKDRLSQAVADSRRQVIILEDPVPVYLVYRTAWAATDGEIHFAEDIYGYDPRLLAAMSNSAPAHPGCSLAVHQASYWGCL
jgi:murein L,D-transpeptidase YcbB/YkuD